MKQTAWGGACAVHEPLIPTPRTEPSDRMRTAAGAPHLNFISSYPLLVRLNPRFWSSPCRASHGRDPGSFGCKQLDFHGLSGSVMVRRSITESIVFFTRVLLEPPWWKQRLDPISIFPVYETANPRTRTPHPKKILQTMKPIGSRLGVTSYFSKQGCGLPFLVSTVEGCTWCWDLTPPRSHEISTALGECFFRLFLRSSSHTFEGLLASTFDRFCCQPLVHLLFSHHSTSPLSHNPALSRTLLNYRWARHSS